MICVTQTRFKCHLPANLQRFSGTVWTTWRHEDMARLKRFLHYLPFVWGNHRWLVDHSHKWPVKWSSYVFFVVALNKLLNWGLRRHDENSYPIFPRNKDKVNVISRAVRPIEDICIWVCNITNLSVKFIPKNDTILSVSSWRPRQNGRRFADDTEHSLSWIKCCTWIQTSVKR